jgi:hypothetical protein
MDLEIAAAAERSIVSQAELVSTLSLAVIGGMLAVLIQVRTHNSSEGTKEIRLKHIWLMWSSMTLAAISIALSYVVSGMLVEMSPQIFSVKFDNSTSFGNQDFGSAPMSGLRIISGFQFLAFLTSIVAGAIFVATNRT